MDRFAAIEVFVKVVEAGNLSRAARQLRISNATVSTRLQQLEQHLGVSLLHRTTRQFGVTDFGHAYYEQCKDILARLDAAESVLSQSPEELSGSMRVDMPIAMGLFLSPLLLQFSEQHPNLKIRASLTNDVLNLVSHGIDVAVRMDEIDDGDLVAWKFYTDQHALCATPTFLEANGTPTSPSDLDPGKCFGLCKMPSGSLREWVFHKDDKSHSIAPNSSLFMNSTVALIQTALLNKGYIYVPKILVREHLESGALVQSLDQWDTAPLTLFVVYPKTRYTAPKVREFATFLRKFDKHLVKDPPALLASDIGQG